MDLPLPPRMDLPLPLCFHFHPMLLVRFVHVRRYVLPPICVEFWPAISQFIIQWAYP